jgi:Rv2525c-like, glycoside hydrolase-like domain
MPLKALLASVVMLAVFASTGARPPRKQTSFLGFDRNDFPGDDALKQLRGRFQFTGYWLNNPPGATANTWSGKRQVVEHLGYGFLVIFNGRTFAQIKSGGDVASIGRADGHAATTAARHEGFPPATVIFLDQEEGGRLLPEQRNYVHAWVDAVIADGFRAGVYCSGIASREGSGASVVTASDIRENAAGRSIAFWVANDSCPPSPGCSFPSKPPLPASSGVAFASVWQFAQSPMRTQFAGACRASYATDGNCYPPEGGVGRIHVDVNAATSADPSHGRTRQQ